MSTQSAKLPGANVKPRPSASLIVVNAQNEVLLVQRNPKAGSFAGAHVFPGGNYDSKQDESFPVTAIRETFEETGLLVASSSTGALPSDSVLDTARELIHSQKQLFQDFLAQHGISLNTGALLPFTQWITPPTQVRRFHTYFYVTFLDTAPAKGFTSGEKQDRVPTPDGGQEVISARFVHPRTAITELKALFFPPQYYLLTTIASCLEGSTNTPEQRARVQQLSEGLFGQMVINPRPLPAKDPEGRMILTYEGDETRGGSPGRLHRCRVKAGKGGMPEEIILERNFDVFREIESRAFSKAAKL